MSESHFRPGMSEQEVIQLLRTDKGAFQEALELYVSANPEMFEVRENTPTISLEEAAEMFGIDLNKH